MKQFYKKVDLRSKTAMVQFLENHFRYSTMNSWNHSTSYANNVKIHSLGLTPSQVDKLYEMTELTEFYERLEPLMSWFAEQHNYFWQVGFNGRSSGYLVLYQGYSKPSAYKSFCTKCGQRSFKTVEETGSCRCGSCGTDHRINYSVSPKEIGIYPGKPTDMNEDFEDWDIYSLKKRVMLVQEFDRLCDQMVALTCELADNYEIEESVVFQPTRVRQLREVIA